MKYLFILKFLVYIRWLSPGCEDSWHYLGFISNGKPSAIYKVTQVKVALKKLIFGQANSQNARFIHFYFFLFNFTFILVA